MPDQAKDLPFFYKAKYFANICHTDVKITNPTYHIILLYTMNHQTITKMSPHHFITF